MDGFVLPRSVGWLVLRSLVQPPVVYHRQSSMHRLIALIDWLTDCCVRPPTRAKRTRTRGRVKSLLYRAYTSVPRSRCAPRAVHACQRACHAWRTLARARAATLIAPRRADPSACWAECAGALPEVGAGGAGACSQEIRSALLSPHELQRGTMIKLLGAPR